MRDQFLYASGVLGVAAACLHAWLGERRVFPHVQIDPERLRLLFRLVWHIGAIAWAAIAVLLIAAPSMGSPTARHWIVVAAVTVFGVSAIGNGWAFRWRHFGWVVLAIIVALALAGL